MANYILLSLFISLTISFITGAISYNFDRNKSTNPYDSYKNKEKRNIFIALSIIFLVTTVLFIMTVLNQPTKF